MAREAKPLLVDIYSPAGPGRYPGCPVYLDISRARACTVSENSSFLLLSRMRILPENPLWTRFVHFRIAAGQNIFVRS